MRVAGIDPGTRSFDVAVLEDAVVGEWYSFETASVAKNPHVLIDLAKSIEVDLVVAPSGYGVPVTWGYEVLDARRFASELLLLTEPGVLEVNGVGEQGIHVYRALVKVVEKLVEMMPSGTVSIPSVILLPTVPWYRKVNKIDMGTADKLASTVLAVYRFSLRESIDYNSVNIVVVEMGYGYTSVISVSNGMIVDGIGGTTASIGPLAAGALDLEVVAGISTWDRWSIFHGGLIDVGGVIDINELIERSKSGDRSASDLLELYVESIAKDVSRALISTPKAEVVIVTGRYADIPEIRRGIAEKVEVEVLTVNGLKGAGNVKEAAQGYAIIGDGLNGGLFKDLIEHMRILEACGTVADYMVHPRALPYREKLRKSYSELVKSPRFCSERL